MSVKTSDKDLASPPRLYDAVFFCTYFANVCMLTAFSLLFRFADFVESLGGDEWHLGWIVGLGTVGALLFRLVQGVAIDHFGAIMVWVLSLAGLIVSLLLHVGITDINSWEVYAIRFLMNLCVAGVFGSWLSFVTLRVPEYKVAEVIGVVGSSGFVGMALGPILGDWIFGTEDALDYQVDMMFYVAAGLIGGSMLFAVAAGIGEARNPHSANLKSRAGMSGFGLAGMRALLRRHHPGFLLVVAIVMGLTISLPGTFLRPFAQQQGVENIKVFFLVYNVVAFVSRLSFRRAPEVLGIRNTILLGLFFMALSMVLYPTADSAATLAIPAVAGGLAHSFLFPSVVAGGTAFFPRENRGLATSLILAMYDTGQLIGAPLVGISLTTARQFGLPDYPLTFFFAAFLIAITAVQLWVMYARGDGQSLRRRNALDKTQDEVG
ncbi:MAG: MFS transporter [Pirellulaceae bacterium]